MTAEPTTRLLLGVDGGGSKTVAMVARYRAGTDFEVLGRARGGPANLRLGGKDLALGNLTAVIDEAMAKAGCTARRLDYAVLALAGSTDSDVRAALEDWATRHPLLLRADIMHDAQPILLSGTPLGWGVALLVGTGSVAWARSEQGRELFRGGWGHWFGDLGSGYDLGRKALTAAATMEDGHGETTLLLERLKAHFGISSLREMPQKLAGSDTIQRQIATGAPVVFEAAEQGDAVASAILAEGVEQICGIVQSAARGLGLPDRYPLALAGSVIGRNAIYRDRVEQRLRASQPGPGEIRRVEDPARACLDIAAQRLTERQESSQ